jgi:hypothetical protein
MPLSVYWLLQKEREPLLIFYPIKTKQLQIYFSFPNSQLKANRLHSCLNSIYPFQKNRHDNWTYLAK